MHASKGHKKILISAPTGAGKTLIAYDITRSALEKNKRVLFTCHRIQLALQTAEKFADLKPSYLQGDSEGYDHANLLQIATLQTLSNREIEKPDVVIIDECHYGIVEDLFIRWPDALFIGLSATPVDDAGYLLPGWDAVVDQYQTADLIKLGWLVPFKCYSPVRVELPEPPLEEDYEEDELERIINKSDINKSVVENYIKYGEGKTFLAYAVNKKHASALCEEFNSAGIRVQLITSDTKGRNRDLFINQLERGDIKGIVNIEIMVAGTDIPSVGCIIGVCPTKSWRKFIQYCGRGIRLLGNSYQESVLNGKEYCILLDCCNAIETHGMPDERKTFKFRKKISRVIDRELNIDEDTEERGRVIKTLTTEKQIFLKRIGSLLDLYEGKVYAKEADLQEDVNRFLEKTGYFWYRQNSGKAFIKDRWVHFASKNGLPDNTVFYRNTSFFFGLELKLGGGRGKLTTHQQETLPEMTMARVLFFIVENVMDVYLAIKHIEMHLDNTDGLRVSDEVYVLSERQCALRKRLNIPLYDLRDVNNAVYK
jgi:superfamily II DNA or RNA helicase